MKPAMGSQSDNSYDVWNASEWEHTVASTQDCLRIAGGPVDTMVGVAFSKERAALLLAAIKDAERYRHWRKSGIEMVHNRQIQEVTGEELDRVTDEMIAAGVGND